MAGDILNGRHNTEMHHHHSDKLNLASLGELPHDAHQLETMRMRDQQIEVARSIAQAERRCHEIATKLAAYYTNQYCGVYEHMANGPARDIVQGYVNRTV